MSAPHARARRCNGYSRSDEPTNGLDIATQNELVRLLQNKTALIATHDRTFANAFATRIVQIEAGALSLLT